MISSRTMMTTSRKTSEPLMARRAPDGRRPAPDRPSGGPRAARARGPACARPASGSAWSWPSTWSTPCTTSSASSSSSVPACSGAWRAATAGHSTTSPSRIGRSPGSTGARSGPVRRQRRHRHDLAPRWRRSGRPARRSDPALPRNCSFRSAMSSSSTNSRLTARRRPRTPSAAQHALGQRRPPDGVDRHGRPARRRRTPPGRPRRRAAAGPAIEVGRCQRIGRRPPARARRRRRCRRRCGGGPRRRR